MPTKCDECGKEEYVIYITREYKRLCGECYDKIRSPYKFEPEDLAHRRRSV